MNKWISPLLYRTLVKRSRTSTCMPILLVTERTWQLFFLYLRQTLIHCDDLLSSRALPCHYGKATCADNLCIPAVCQNLLGLLFNFFLADQVRSSCCIFFSRSGRLTGFFISAIMHSRSLKSTSTVSSISYAVIKIVFVSSISLILHAT
jgi:hypothetical protein